MIWVYFSSRKKKQQHTNNKTIELAVSSKDDINHIYDLITFKEIFYWNRMFKSISHYRNSTYMVIDCFMVSPCLMHTCLLQVNRLLQIIAILLLLFIYILPFIDFCDFHNLHLNWEIVGAGHGFCWREE
jgi:hypothetical protein